MQRLRLLLVLVGAALAGALVAVQSRVNGGLAQQIGNGYVAAALSFVVGTVILIAMVLLSGRAKQGLSLVRDEVRSGNLPVWTLIAGVSGALFVLGQGLISPLTGVALFTVGIVAGQVLGGLVFDRMGLGPGGRLDPTPTRLIGTGLAIVAVAISAAGGIGGGSLWLVVFPLFAGVAVAWQFAANGLVRAAARSAITATFVSFTVGAVVLVVVAGLSVLLQGWPETWPSNPVFYIGGSFGVIVVVLMAALVRIAGVLLLSMSNVAGQLVASLLLDAVLPIADGVTLSMAIGAAVALVAVAIAAIPRPSTAR